MECSELIQNYILTYLNFGLLWFKGTYIVLIDTENTSGSAMSTEERARELLAQDRKHEEHIHENMLTRAVEEVEELEINNTEEKARELLAQDRKHEEHIHENMLTRSHEEIQH